MSAAPTHGTGDDGDGGATITMRVTLQHVGAGCNRVVSAVSWGHCGLVVYGAQQAVMVYDPQAARVVGTLLGHTDVVNCVYWVPPAHFGGAAAAAAAAAAGVPALLASGAADNTVHLWLWTGQEPQPWQQLARLEGHTAPVTSVSTFSPAPGQLLLASTAGDGDALIWECSAAEPQAAVQGAWRLRQRIHVGHQLQNCAALACLPQDPDWLVLALGGVDPHVRLYTCPPGGQFAEVCKLSGHGDWVRGLAAAQMEDGRLLLASAAQDKYVRIWAITLEEPTPAGTAGAAAGTGDSSSAADLTQQLIVRYAPRPRLATPRHSYSATLEALLIGHEDWVHSVAWHPLVPAAVGEEGGQQQQQRWVQPPCLLSASMDRTMMLWKPDKATGLWMCVETVGDAGPNHLGYYTGVFNGDGSGILAHGFTGALHIWRRDGGAWVPQHALGGHFAPIVDACWGVDDACLLTVSVDQTARLTSRFHDGHWCEVARPQVHGHDFSSAAFIPVPGTPGRYLYASSSEEKVIRVFEAPQAFRDTLALARGEAVASSADSRSAFGASLPALGLSNKAVYADVEDEPASAANGGSSSIMPGFTEGPDFAPNSAPSAVAGPPLEEHLAQNTLWPEVRKLYGHGNDVYCLAADPLGAYLASACRAQSASTAGIRLWDTAKWVGLGELPAHTLTVTQLAFSPDGRYLASASRDRCCALFERCDGASPPFRLVSKVKAHGRIVWGLGWSPDSILLATGSRDNTVKVWAVAAPQQQAQQAAGSGSSISISGGLVLAATLPFSSAVRAVAFAPTPCGAETGAAGAAQAAGGAATRRYQLAVGLEDGSIHLEELQCSAEGSAAAGDAALAGSVVPLVLDSHRALWRTQRQEQHAAAVRRLCWRREGGEGAAGGEAQPQPQTQRLLLASCGEDHAVRVFSLEL